MLCRLASTRTMPLAPTPTTIRGVSARGTRTSVVPNWACLQQLRQWYAWAASASALGYWVDNTLAMSADAVVFAPGGRADAGAYGHVAVLKDQCRRFIESPNPMPRDWCDFDPPFSAAEARQVPVRSLIHFIGLHSVITVRM